MQKEMNHLYDDFLSDIRMRRQKEGHGREAFMDKVLDQAEGEAKKQDGLTYSDHEMWFMGGEQIDCLGSSIVSRHTDTLALRVAGTLTEGGSDTSASIITAFVQVCASPQGDCPPITDCQKGHGQRSRDSKESTEANR